MLAFIGIESLAANALIELMERESFLSYPAPEALQKLGDHA